MVNHRHSPRGTEPVPEVAGGQEGRWGAVKRRAAKQKESAAPGLAFPEPSWAEALPLDGMTPR